MKSILVVGGTGLLGKHLVNELRAQDHEVHVLVRTTTLAQPDKIDPLIHAGIHIHEGDLTDRESLESACQDQDIVLSVVGSRQLTQQTSLIQAAEAVGVPYFIPSEFGLDPHAVNRGDSDLLDAKAEIQQQLAQSRLNTTRIYTQGFMEYWGTGLGELGHRRPPEKVAVFGNGDQQIALITLADIARYVAAIINDPETFNREVRITCNIHTQEEMIHTWEELSGNKVQRNPIDEVSLAQRIAEASSQEQAAARIVAQMHRCMWVQGAAVHQREGTLEATELYPEIEPVTLREFLGKFLKNEA